MLKWALLFAVISLIAGIFGFIDVASASAGIAKFICFLFLGLCALFAVAAITLGNKVRDVFRGRQT